MLVRFTVCNYRSMRYEQEISLVAMDDHPDLAMRPVPGTRHQLLPVAGIFGPNASGKSNFIEAFEFLTVAVRESHQRWLPDDTIDRAPYLFCDDCSDQPSEFTVEFVAKGLRYEYHVACDNQRFTTELLYVYGRESKRRRMLFERRNTTEIEYGPTFRGSRRAIEDILRPNSTFVSAATTLRNPTVRPVYAWFNATRVALDGNFAPRLVHTLHLFQDHDRKAVMDLLKVADFDIADIRIERKKQSGTSGDKPSPSATGSPDSDRIYTRNFREFDISLVHDSGGAPLSLWDESNGTRTWLGIIGPIYTALEAGWVLLIDEIDARLHTVLVSRLIQLFQDPDTNPRGAQLIFNSHDTNLMGPNLPTRLHRDQIWLTERSTVDGTRLWPLTEYRVRDGIDNIERSYLRGRYGAIPEVQDYFLPDLHGEDDEPGGAAESSDPETRLATG
jgi:hypothetical protein